MGMADEEFARLRPRDLATVWGTALGQIADLWRSAYSTFLEFGSAERPISGGESAEVILAPRGSGRPPQLAVRQMVGESWGDVLPGSRVLIQPKAPLPDGRLVFECTVQEDLGAPTRGDIYRGDVVDEGGLVVARIALDAGS